MTDADHAGRRESRTDIARTETIARLAATLDVPMPDHLPPLWHWALFQLWQPTSSLGADGHARRGDFLPPVEGLPRRMWAGGRVRFLARIGVDETLRRDSEILRVDEKQGASGRLVFVTIRHAIHGAGGLAIEEEQDIVYRGAEGTAVRAAALPAPPPAHAAMRVVVPTPVLLFRYSALTGNAHRIHYDQQYVTGDEGYPGIVVHGPLQATWLAQAAAGLFRTPLATFDYRGVRPAFHDRALTMVAWRDGDAATAETRDDTGAACMTARTTCRS